MQGTSWTEGRLDCGGVALPWGSVECGSTTEIRAKLRSYGMFPFVLLSSIIVQGLCLIPLLIPLVAS
jgi:hypothetical protein